MVASLHNTSNPYMIHFGMDVPETTDLDNVSQENVRGSFASTASVHTSNPYLVLSDTHLDADFYTDGRLMDATTEWGRQRIRHARQTVNHTARKVLHKAEDGARKIRHATEDVYNSAANAVERSAKANKERNDGIAETETERRKKREAEIAKVENQRKDRRQTETADNGINGATEDNP